jgi:hypothetical protein
MTRTRLERLATRPCPATRTPPALLHAIDLDATAAALAAAITEAPCGCWIVQRPDGQMVVPCGAHEMPGEGWAWL